MKIKLLIPFIICLSLFSCQNGKDSSLESENKGLPTWSLEDLKQRGGEHLDSSYWDQELLSQDIETYAEFIEVFQSYPLNKSPFPVAEYDYAVSSIPFIIENDGHILKGVRIGEYENADSDKVIDKLTLIVLTNDKEAEESTLVDSRNFPYLTAEGYFKVSNNKYDWVFAASPDGYSTLIVNMKLFDLRFGETILIYPQADMSFFYDQIMDSPNNYDIFEEFKTSVFSKERIKNQLRSARNIE